MHSTVHDALISCGPSQTSMLILLLCRLCHQWTLLSYLATWIVIFFFAFHVCALCGHHCLSGPDLLEQCQPGI